MAALTKKQLEQQVANQSAFAAKQQSVVDSYHRSVAALQAAIAATTDAKKLKGLNAQLATAQLRLSNQQKKYDVFGPRISALQAKILAIVPPGGTTPPPPPSDGGVSPPPPVGVPPPTDPLTGGSALGYPPGSWPATQQANYWDQLRDRKLGTRLGASGWHGNVAPVAPVAPGALVPPTVTPPPVVTAPAVTPPPTAARALTAQELKWRTVFDPRGWANSLNIPSPVVAPPVGPVNPNPLNIPAPPPTPGTTPPPGTPAPGAPTFGGGWN